MWFARYKYDFNGLRIVKQIRPVGKNPQETRYIYEGKHLLYETNVIGNVIVRYHWMGDRILGETRNGENFFYFLDALGSIVAVTAQDGSVVARIQYDAYGSVTATQGSHEGLFVFTGYYSDDETGLYYAQQRYYDSELGAFISEDSFEGVMNDPPIHSDITTEWVRFHKKNNNDPTAGQVADFAKYIDGKYEANFTWPGF